MATLTLDERFQTAEATQFGLVWQRFRRHRLGLVGLFTFTIIALAVTIIPIFSPYNYEPQYANQMRPAGFTNPVTGEVNLLGTDQLGRDVFSRIFEGGRNSLAVAVISAIAIVIIGSIFGAMAAFYGGWVDAVIMRVVDFMSVLPLLPAYLIAIRFLASSWNLEDAQSIKILATVSATFIIFGWMGMSRLVRGSILSLRAQPFVEASRALGASGRRIIFKHLLPNSVAPILVAGTFALGDFIILESILSYFGVGIIDPPAPSWGNMLAAGQDLIWTISSLNPMEEVRGFLVFLPSLMILVTMLSINYVGDALRDALDPRAEIR